MTYELIIGIFGSGILLVAFLMNQVGKLDRDAFTYDLLNFVGGLLLVIYAYLISSWPFLILNGVWTVFSLKDVITGISKK